MAKHLVCDGAFSLKNLLAAVLRRKSGQIGRFRQSLNIVHCKLPHLGTHFAMPIVYSNKPSDLIGISRIFIRVVDELPMLAHRAIARKWNPKWDGTYHLMAIHNVSQKGGTQSANYARSCIHSLEYSSSCKRPV